MMATLYTQDTNTRGSAQNSVAAVLVGALPMLLV